MTYRRRITWVEMVYTRNPTPARGPEVYSLDELRYYIREFWTNRLYGICSLRGGKSAFIKACGLGAPHFEKVLLSDPPKMQFLRAETQRRLSKAVRNVLTGKIHYETDPRNVSHAIGIFDLEGRPPVGSKEVPRAVEFRLQFSRFGPRIHRLA